jgi:hypothetical protein
MQATAMPTRHSQRTLRIRGPKSLCFILVHQNGVVRIATLAHCGSSADTNAGTFSRLSARLRTSLEELRRGVALASEVASEVALASASERARRFARGANLANAVAFHHAVDGRTTDPQALYRFGNVAASCSERVDKRVFFQIRDPHAAHRGVFVRRRCWGGRQ